MLNYIKAELWKLLRRRSLYGLVLLLAACVALFLWLYSGGAFPGLAAAVSATMLVGMLLAPPLVQMVDGGGRDTLKNELSFGLSRGRVYWGKLLSALLLGLILCLVLVGGCLGAGWLLLPHGDGERVSQSLDLVLFCLLGALPVWCGMFALCHMLALTVRSPAAWVTGYYLVFFLGQPVLVLLAMVLLRLYEASWQFSLLTAVLLPYSLLMPSWLEGWHTLQYQLWCWGVGLGWMAGSTLLGLRLFRRREAR